LWHACRFARDHHSRRRIARSQLDPHHDGHAGVLQTEAGRLYPGIAVHVLLQSIRKERYQPGFILGQHRALHILCKPRRTG